MPETVQRYRHSISEMNQEVTSVSGRKFSVITSGKTNGVHLEFVKKLRQVGHIEVTSPEECDYILLFCPVTSRVGTDIGDALQKSPGGKQQILVVMHHTFNPNLTVAESRRLVDNSDVLLTVDCLFYEDKLLSCDRNDIAWFEIQKTLGVPPQEVTTWNTIRNWLKPVLIAVCCIMALTVIIGTIIYIVETKG